MNQVQELQQQKDVKHIWDEKSKNSGRVVMHEEHANLLELLAEHSS